MYTLQFCNAVTKTVIREESFKDIAPIAGIIKGAEGSKNLSDPIYIIDHSLRPLEAKYVSQSVIHTRTGSVYQLFFKINLENTPLK
jgi:hypothetical protein